MFQFFERLINPFPEAEPGQPPAGLFAFCRHYTRGLEKYLLLMALTNGIVAVIEVYLFGFLGQLVDWLSSKDPGTFFSEELNSLLWMGFITLVALPITVWLHSSLVHQTLLGNYPMIIRWQTHRYLLGQSLAFYQNEFAGRVATKVMQTSLAVREAVMKILDVLLYVVVYFGALTVLLANADWRLSIPLLGWLGCYILILIFFLPRLQKISALQADARSIMTGRVVDTYNNFMTVKLFSHSRREATYAKDSMQGFLATVYPQMRLATQLHVSIWILNMLLIFSITALSISLWSINSVTAGAIAAAIGACLRLNGMSQWIMWEVALLFENIGVVKDGTNTLSKPLSVVDQDNAKALAVTQGLIEFKNVRFHYDNQAQLFDDLCLTIKPGEKVGLVGPSGAGKSTLINLLLRFYDLQNGEIAIDGQNIRSVSQESLRAAIGVVTQDTSLLHRSVRDNIIYGQPDSNEADMIAAAKQAEAHEFILDLADIKGRKDYAAHVGERGVNLSGGQRQRIAIARVLLKNAPILILDEATSALDSEVEAAIQSSLQQLMHDKTVIAIAHRLSTIAAMDRLIVLNDGKIVEQGTHQELVNNDGIYAQLWARQSGGFFGTKLDNGQVEYAEKAQVTAVS